MELTNAVICGKVASTELRPSPVGDPTLVLNIAGEDGETDASLQIHITAGEHVRRMKAARKGDLVRAEGMAWIELECSDDGKVRAVLTVLADRIWQLPADKAAGDRCELNLQASR